MKLENLINRYNITTTQLSTTARRLTSVLLFMTALVLFTFPVFAEDTPETVVTIEQLSLPKNITGAPPAAVQQPTPKQAPSSQPSERPFDPTESISEDLSVPFPVDI